MRSAYFTLIFILACACVLAAQTVDIRLPEAEVVPAYLSDNQKNSFALQRGKLEEWRLDLEIRLQAHNGSCGKVDPQDWALFGNCRESKMRLEEEIRKYQEALKHYGDLLISLRRISGEDVPAKRLPEESLKYFMLGNYFELIDFEDRPKRAWPGPQNPNKAAADDYEPIVEANDKKLLKPLDYSAIDSLGLDEAAQIIIARQEAREREAMRMSSKMLAEERDRLKREGVIKPGENIIKKEMNDPEFYRLMKGIYIKAAEKEIQDIRNAAQTAVNELAEVISRKDKKNDPDLMRRELEERNNIADFYRAKMRDLDQRYSRKLDGEIQGLKNQGYYKEGDDLLQKDASDLRFRQAAGTAARKALTQKRSEEDSAFSQAVREMNESCDLEEVSR